MAQRVIRFFHLLLRVGMPLILVLTIGTNVYDRAYPWSLADDMVPKRSGQIRLLIGASYSSRAAYAASGKVINRIERSAEYVFYPEVLRTRESYALSRRSDRDPSLSINAFSPALHILEILFVVALSIAAWWLPLAKRKTVAHVA